MMFCIGLLLLALVMAVQGHCPANYIDEMISCTNPLMSMGFHGTGVDFSSTCRNMAQVFNCLDNVEARCGHLPELTNMKNALLMGREHLGYVCNQCPMDVESRVDSCMSWLHSLSDRSSRRQTCRATNHAFRCLTPLANECRQNSHVQQTLRTVSHMKRLSGRC